MHFKSSGQTSLEDLFFLEKDKKLIENLKKMKQMKETKENLSKVSGIHNDQVLEKLVQLEIHPETLASIAIIPLVEIAWADGRIDKKESDAILYGAENAGFAKDSIDYSLLERWLTHKPEKKLLEAWIHFIQGLCEKMNSEEKRLLEEEIFSHADQVAKASGGFLGLGSKISDSEQAVMDEMKKAFLKN